MLSPFLSQQRPLFIFQDSRGKIKYYFVLEILFKK